MTEEERDEGKVNWRVYWAYVRDGGVVLSVLTVLAVCGGEAMSQLQQVLQRLLSLLQLCGLSCWTCSQQLWKQGCPPVWDSNLGSVWELLAWLEMGGTCGA